MSDHQHDEQLVARLERLQSRGEKMKEDSFRAKAILEQAAKDRLRLREEAEKKFGTSDPAKLRALRDQWRLENTQVVDEYERILNETASRLEELNKILG